MYIHARGICFAWSGNQPRAAGAPALPRPRPLARASTCFLHEYVYNMSLLIRYTFILSYISNMYPNSVYTGRVLTVLLRLLGRCGNAATPAGRPFCCKLQYFVTPTFKHFSEIHMFFELLYSVREGEHFYEIWPPNALRSPKCLLGASRVRIRPARDIFRIAKANGNTGCLLGVSWVPCGCLL